MKETDEALALVLLAALAAGLIFLFDGEPDVWDVMRSRAMKSCQQSEAQE
jgi:hypothetical protein